MSSTSIKPVFGGAVLGTSKSFPDLASIEEVYKLLEEGGVTTIDTSHDFGNSEEWLGKTGAGKRFIIDSKTAGGIKPGESTREGIVEQTKELVEHLGVNGKVRCRPTTSSFQA